MTEINYILSEFVVISGLSDIIREYSIENFCYLCNSIHSSVTFCKKRRVVMKEFHVLDSIEEIEVQLNYTSKKNAIFASFTFELDYQYESKFPHAVFCIDCGNTDLVIKYMKSSWFSYYRTKCNSCGCLLKLYFYNSSDHSNEAVLRYFAVGISKFLDEVRRL